MQYQEAVPDHKFSSHTEGCAPVHAFEKVPYLSNTYPQLLGKELNEDFDEKKFSHIIRHSNIHKLTYKNLNEEKDNSFYKHILGMEF